MIFETQVLDIRNAVRTADAIIELNQKFQNWPILEKRTGYLISKVSTKKIPYLYVFDAGPVAGNYSRYTVRFPVPKSLKQFSGTGYGRAKLYDKHGNPVIDKKTGKHKQGSPNGYEFYFDPRDSEKKRFESPKQAAKFVKSIASLDPKELSLFLAVGDGTHDKKMTKALA